jgi:hypothetical protein
MASLETPDLAHQAAALIDLPHPLRQLAAGRLAMVLSELNDRAAVRP